MFAISTFVLVSALTLCSTLTGVVQATGPRPVCDGAQGDTCTSIGQQVGAGQQGLVSMNPGINCGGTLTPGNVICTKQHTPTCALTKPATSTKCDELAAACNITVDKFVEYNDDVNNNCDNLIVETLYVCFVCLRDWYALDGE
ncbi:hypothetical protein BJV78DRAFT_1133149 [Lactifluus subvellereus]|nr:hypothetical protein BJV78DRAFT_1133149 [Lactifluus subvellereus]